MLFGGFTIRPALVNDACSIARVHVGTSKATYSGILPESHLQRFTVEWRERFWADELARPGTDTPTLVAVDPASGVVGFASGGKQRDESLLYEGELYAIYILPSAQRRGLGTLLVERFARELDQQGYRSMSVWVLAANPSTAFYQKLGGQLIAQKFIEPDGQRFLELAYGWKDLSELLARMEMSSL
jgi:L-amino acid N-acyltransferase YncA